MSSIISGIGTYPRPFERAESWQEYRDRLRSKAPQPSPKLPVRALIETEQRVEALREEFEGLRRSRNKVFQAPPVAWIEERVEKLQELLEESTRRSALILRKLLGRIELEPRTPEIGKRYYMARTDLDALALLDDPSEGVVSEGGSNALRWWTRSQ